MRLRKFRSLILASASPQRKELLARIGLPFTVVPSRVGEDSPEKDPRRLVVDLALRKALSVAKNRPRDLVLGADTVVWCRGKFCLKPRDARDGARMLGWLNGRWQEIHTGVALVADGGGRVWTGAAMSRALARKLPAPTLQALAAKHLDKAGGYAVQDKDDPFIRKVVGERSNVIGLPLGAVRRLLRRALGPGRGPRAGKRKTGTLSARRPRRR